MPFWGDHSLDAPRFYSIVCQYYGGDVDNRKAFAEELELPEERAETCEQERQQVEQSWEKFLIDLENDGPPAETLKFASKVSADNPLHQSVAGLIEEEVALLNTALKLPQTLEIEVDSCGDANAYYDPSEKKVVLCTEFIDFIASRAAELLDS